MVSLYSLPVFSLYSLCPCILCQRIPLDSSQWGAYLMFNLVYKKFGHVASTLGKLGLMSVIGKVAKALSYPDFTRHESKKRALLKYSEG